MTENPQPRNRRYVTYEKFSEILGKLPERIREYARDAFADYIPRIGLFGRMFEIDEKTDPAKVDTKKLLAGYGSVREALEDLKERLTELENDTPLGAGRGQKTKQDTVAKRLEELEKENEKLRITLIEVIKGIYEGMPDMQKYLKLLDGDDKA